MEMMIRRAGWKVALGGVAAVGAGGMVLAGLALARRRARREVEALRNRLHDFVGAELAGMRSKDRGARALIEELRATIWTLKQDRPTVVGLIGFLTDWAWRYGREQNVLTRFRLPTERVAPRPVDFDVAEAFQALVRIAFSNGVEQAGARTIELTLRSESEVFVVEIQDDGALFGPGTGEEGKAGGLGDRGLGLVRLDFERLGGELRIEGGTKGIWIRASCPLRGRA